MTPVEVHGDLWLQKTRVRELSCGVVFCGPTFSRFTRTPTCDGQTDGRTDTGPWLVPGMHSIAR